MIDREKISVEDNIKFRHQLGQDFVRLIEDFEETMDLFTKRLCSDNSNSLIDVIAYIHLVEFMKSEAWNIIERSKQIYNIRCETILPFVHIINIGSKYKRLDKITQFRMCFRAYPALENIEVLLQINSEMRRAIRCLNSSPSQLNKIFPNPKDLEIQFDKQFEQYIKEHNAELEYYAEDITNAKEALRELKQEYKNCIAVKLWNEQNRRIGETLTAMYMNRCLEIDLLPLFEFLARFNTLHQLIEKDSQYAKPDNKNLTINTGSDTKINIENYHDNSHKTIHQLP